jgi:hypothetical protein
MLVLRRPRMGFSGTGGSILAIRRLVVVLLATLAGSGGATPAFAQERVRPFTKVEGWRIATLMDKGRPSGCMAVSSFVDGTSLVIGYSSRWWLALNNETWRQTGSRPLQVQILVDGKPVHQAAAVQKDRLVVMEFGEGRDRISALMGGQTIGFVTTKGRSNFSLRGSAKATSAIADCVKARGIPPIAANPDGGSNGGGGGAFGAGPSTPDKAAGAAGPALPRRKADRAQTLEFATTYLGKLGTPYTVLAPEANLLKNFPVNWKFADGGFGGMVIYTGSNSDVQKFFDELVAENTRLCKGTSGVQRQTPATSAKQVTRYSAVGTCEESGQAYLTDFTVLAGDDLIVAIVNIGTVGGGGTQQRQEQNKKWSL